MENHKNILLDPSTVYFLGAGASWDAGLPLGDEGSAHIVCSIFDSIGKTDILNEIGSLMWPRFEVVMSTMFEYLPNLPRNILDSFCGIPVGPTYSVIASSLSSGHLWLTTNFDDQLAQALRPTGLEVRSISSRKSIAALAEKSPTEHVIVKLHGDSSSDDFHTDLGVGIEQILRRFPKSCHDAIVKMAHGKPLVVIGYAYRDPDLIDLINALIEGASSVLWITKGKIEDRVLSITKEMRHVEFSEKGALATICKAFCFPLPDVQRNITTWRKSIESVIAENDSVRLTLLASRMLLIVGDLSCRSAAKRLLLPLSSVIDPAVQTYILMIESELLLQEGNLDSGKAEAFLLKLNTIEDGKSNLPSSLSVELAIVGASFCHRTGRLGYARDILDRCLKRQMNDADRCKIIMSISFIALYMGTEHISEAEVLLKKAIALADSSNEPILMAEVKQRIAVLLMRTNRPAEALEYLSDIKPVVDEIGEPRRLAIWNVNMAECFRHLRQYKKATKLNESIVTIARNRGDEELLMNSLTNLGLCLVCGGSLKKAQRAFSDSLQVALRLPGEAKGNALYNLGWVSLITSAYKTAYGWFYDAYSAFYDAGLLERQAAAISMLAWCALSIEDDELANQIMVYAHTEELIPRGSHQEDYDRVSYVTTKLDIENIRWEDLVTTFYSNPESLFHLMRYIIERYGKFMSTTDKFLAAALLFDGAVRSDVAPMIVYASSTATDVITRHGRLHEESILNSIGVLSNETVLAEITYLKEKEMRITQKRLKFNAKPLHGSAQTSSDEGSN